MPGEREVIIWYPSVSLEYRDESINPECEQTISPGYLGAA
jgi:hypothetical protein